MAVAAFLLVTATIADVRTRVFPTLLVVSDRCLCLAAAFLEFHEPLAAWLHPATQGPSGDDTILASGEVYNNFVRMDVIYKSSTI